MGWVPHVVTQGTAALYQTQTPGLLELDFTHIKTKKNVCIDTVEV